MGDIQRPYRWVTVRKARIVAFKRERGKMAAMCRGGSCKEI